MSGHLAIADAPSDATWWLNGGHGRELHCHRHSATLFVPVTECICSDCREVMQVETA